MDSETKRQKKERACFLFFEMRHEKAGDGFKRGRKTKQPGSRQKMLRRRPLGRPRVLFSD